MILIISISSTERRRALAGLVVALLLGVSGGLLSFFLPGVVYPQPVAEMDSWFSSGLALLTVAVQTTACANVHSYLVRRDRKQAEVQLDAD